ncbi:ankyrin [Neocallimastix californiae]|uniref:Ankyrin n=1 Tax=Neocallimastix californiae TaxID=1754190 RepID=A0A1Y2FKU8_9FUNG|nr:ankyrin [Neocallimastix californiae]|eukprot:ORY84549.1 ankyrin [Neocallimastix californiae]
MFKLLIDYANKNNIILNVNEKDTNGYFPIFGILNNNNYEMLKLLIEYTKKNNNKLKILEKDIENAISSNYYGNNKLEDISKINSKFIKLLYNYENKKIIEIIYSENGKLSEKFKELRKEEEIEEEQIKKKREERENYNNENNDNPLTFECKKGNIKKVEELINKGKKIIINKRNSDGDTPLIIACKKNNFELVECLLKHENIKINKESTYGINPLMVACYFKNKKLVDYLITHNAKVNIQDKKKNLPLHIECYLHDTEITQYLVKKDNTLINVANSYNDTPLKIAKEININYNIINILEGKSSEDDNSESKNENSSSTIIYENSNSNNSNEQKPIKYIEFYKILSQSICKITTDTSIGCIGTGFFIEIPIPSENYPMRGLMTNNHVLNENNLKTGNSFIICLANNEEQTTEIEINNEDFIFTSELIDVTFIEINYKIIKEIDPIFLKPSNEDAKINESIMIFQYSNEEYSLLHGNIKNICSFNYYHEVLINEESCGSPLLNKNNEIVGIHKSSTNINNVNNNIAIKYSEISYAIKTLFNNISIYGMERAKKSARLLLRTEIETMNNYGLQLKLSSEDNIKKENKKLKKLNELELVEKSLFYCEFNNKLLFYRTNYSWYITLLSRRKKNFISEYNLDNIKQLEWHPIISNSTKLDNYIHSKIKGREYVLITWLKLSELMYL